MNLLFCCVTLAAVVGSTVHAIFPSNSEVIELTDSNFDKKVLQGNEIWFVEFYAPWCGHCQKFAPEYAKAAKALSGLVKVAAFDADKYPSIAGRYGVTGFPTIKIFVDKNKPNDYKGDRTAIGLTDEAFKVIKNKVLAQLQGVPYGSANSSKKSSSGDNVVELTDANFDQLVLNSNDIWLVEFFAPWCGHCKNLAPHWSAAATELKGKVKLGALDATVHASKAQEFNIRGYPTIKFFPSGTSSYSGAEEYTGGRTSADIVSWALQKHQENVPAPEINEIVNEEVFKSGCSEHALCVISVLPHILDCQSSCRTEYLNTLRTLGDKFKQKLWGWLWAEAGQQPELESSLEIGGFGYPALAVLNVKKMKYSILRGSFSEDGIKEFLRDLSYGRGTTAPVKGASLPTINTIEPWDGKDGELPAVEDIDLSDVELDNPPKTEL
ncbi:protein disulfide-isomerase A6 homolog [Adelges cooleyi]|uniref:protein disulfide-isomerase A6 homolog n=1 Tax=Adelges cooleyi TaxID=133065 RepID=UPI00217F8C63|nr:protein disulfide-isomerase A6 homolog [Adelges cooleyi]